MASLAIKKPRDLDDEHLGGWRLAGAARAGHPRGVLRLWAAFEWLELRLRTSHAIPNTQGGLFRVEFWRYRGRTITLPDGVEVRRGDRVAVPHFQNRALARLTEQSLTWRLLRLMTLDLRALAAWAATPDFPPGVKALFGVTLIYRAAPRLGFTVRARPHTLKAWLDREFMLGLLALYHPWGTERLLAGRTRETWPAEVWMSLGELARRYGARTPGALPPDVGTPTR
jgi:hypothetical protein